MAVYLFNFRDMRGIPNAHTEARWGRSGELLYLVLLIIMTQGTIFVEPFLISERVGFLFPRQVELKQPHHLWVSQRGIVEYS